MKDSELAHKLLQIHGAQLDASRHKLRTLQAELHGARAAKAHFIEEYQKEPPTFGPGGANTSEFDRTIAQTLVCVAEWQKIVDDNTAMYDFVCRRICAGMDQAPACKA